MFAAASAEFRVHRPDPQRPLQAIVWLYLFVHHGAMNTRKPSFPVNCSVGLARAPTLSVQDKNRERAMSDPVKGESAGRVSDRANHMFMFSIMIGLV
jgi:hypothetical protein